MNWVSAGSFAPKPLKRSSNVGTININKPNFIYLVIKNEKLLENSLAFGMMGFLFPSIGNPMLFSPVSCLLHCTSNYLIRNKRSKNNV